MIQVELAPKYWIHQPGDFSAKAGRRRLFAFCNQIATAMRTNSPLEIIDMREMLVLARNRLDRMKSDDRLPFIALYCLFNLVVPADDRIDDNSDIVRSYRKNLDLPTIEAMLLALFTRSVPQWDLGDHESALHDYLDGRGRDRGIRMDNLLEAGLTLELAERYRGRGDTEKANGLIHLALENHPGNQGLMRLEREFDPAEQIQWEAVMGLPNHLRSGDS
ncbi:MAG: hypothetical protein OXK77_04855 [Gemmatimonadota bacterium]|nr:hypothetical protein [Gemmatimonadota bacterium]